MHQTAVPHGSCQRAAVLRVELLTWCPHARTVTFYEVPSVMQAFVCTASVFVGLTLYSFQTKRDFTPWLGTCITLLWVLIFSSVLQVWATSSLLGARFCLFSDAEITALPSNPLVPRTFPHPSHLAQQTHPQTMQLRQVFFPAGDTFQFLCSMAGAALFCVFIVVDTQMMLYKLSADEYILCAINLYLDILNLFLQILRAVGKRK